MTLQLLHPQRDMLESFGLGKLADEEASFVERHLADCPACCETLLELQDDTFVELVRHGQAPFGIADDADHELHSLPPELADHPRYRVLELLGRGGMGEVYRAEHRLMNRPVALKVIHRRLMKDAHAVERFRREVQAAARLSHPNIVAAYDAEQAGDLHFLAMEYVDGTDLAQLIQERGPLPVPEACEYIRQAAEGLQHAHERGMVHRDIKPQNLMLVESGKRKAESGIELSAVGCRPSALVKILDFGLARFAAEADEPLSPPADSRPAESPRLTSLGAAMGTPDYVAPEQSRCAREADIRSDIYSLGCTFYYLLAGRPPFAGTSKEKLAAHSAREPQPLSALRDDLPPGLEAVIARMMAKDPHDRYPTPREVAFALECGDSSPLLAKHAGQSPRENNGARLVTAKQPTKSKAKSGDKSPHSKLLVLLAAVLLVLLGAVFYIKLGETTVKFEIEDPALAVHFGKDEITIDNDGRPIRITPGEKQTFTVMQDGLEALTTAFTLRKGADVVLRVSIRGDKVEIAPSDDELALEAKPPAAASKTPAGPPALPVLIEPQQSFNAERVAHAAEVGAMSVTADRQTIVTSHIPGTVSIWDPAQAKGLVSWSSGQDPPMSSEVLAVSPDGAIVAQVSSGFFQPKQRNVIRISEARTGKLLREMGTLNGPGRSLAFSPDGRTLLTGEIVGATQNPARTYGFGPAVRWWDVETGREIESFEKPELLTANPAKNERIWVSDLVFSPDGELCLALGTIERYEDQQTVFTQCGYAWDTATGRVMYRLPESDTAAMRVAFTPDGKHFVTGHASVDIKETAVRIWESATGKAVRVIEGHRENIGDLDVSRDGRFAATVSIDGTIRVWNLQAGKEVAYSATLPEITYGNRSEHRTPLPKTVCFLRDSRSFVTGGGDGLKLWRLPDEVAGVAVIPEKQHPTPPPSDALPPLELAPALTFVADGPAPNQPIQALEVAGNRQTIATSHAGGALMIWDAVTRRPVNSWKTDHPSNQALAVSPDGRLVAVGDRDRKGLQIWDARQGVLIHNIEHEGHILALFFSPDGGVLAAGGMRGVSLDAEEKLTYGFDPAVRLWNVETGRELRPLDMPEWLAPPREKEAVASVGELAISPDGQLLVARGAQSWRAGKTTAGSVVAFAWDIATGRRASQVRFRGEAKFAFAPNGLLVTADGFGDPEPYALRVWDPATGVLMHKLAGHQSSMVELDVSPDGRLVLSIDLNGDLRIWDLVSGKQVAAGDVSLPSDLRRDPRQQVQGGFLADGRSFVTSNGGEIEMWRLPTGIVGLQKPSGDREGAQAATAALLQSSATLTGEHVDGSAPVVAFAVSGDRKFVFTSHAAGLAAVSDLAERRELASWQTGINASSVLAASADGKFVAVGQFNGGAIEVWNATDQRLRSRLEGHSDYVRTLALAPHGDVLVSGAMQREATKDDGPLLGNEAALRFWDVPAEQEAKGWEGPELLGLPRPQSRIDIDAARFSPFGGWLAVVGDVMRYNQEGTLVEIEDFGFLWDVESRKSPRRLSRVKTHATTVAFTPNERLLVTGHAGTNVESCVLRVWDVNTGRVLREMAGHDSPIMSLDVSPDGELAVSVDARGEVRVWRLADGENIARIDGRPSGGDESSERRPPRFAAAFLADGRTLVTAGMEGVKLWPLANGDLPAKLKILE